MGIKDVNSLLTFGIQNEVYIDSIHSYIAMTFTD